MSIINSSDHLYAAGADTEIRAVLDLAFDLTAEITPHLNTSRRVPVSFAPEFAFEITPHIFNRHLPSEADFAADFGGDIYPRSRSQKGVEFVAEFASDINPNVQLSLSIPAPIINEFGENAFTGQYYAARLLADGVEIPIQSATIDKPKGTIGKRVSCVISKKQLSLLAPEKSYKFQIGTRTTWNGTLTWHTVLENAALDARSYSLAWATNQPADNLTFGAIEPLADKLGKFPTKNLIFFDPRKTSVDLSNQTATRVDGTSESIETVLIEKNGLSLYYIFDQLKTRLGFSAIEKNIPNFELTRVDFPFSSSWNDVLKGIVGVFEPVIYTIGNVLWILDKTAALPEDFAPRDLTIHQFSNWTQSRGADSLIDGLTLSYVDSTSQADTFTDRTVTTSEESGSFGNADFTETRISRTYRDWKNSADLTAVLRTDLISETHSTYDNGLNLIGREINTHSYDAQGKRTNSNRTVEAEVPNLSDGGAAALLTVRRENQAVFYANDANQKGRIFQSKSETLVSGLIAIDSENTYFDKTGAQTPFKQNFEKTHETGNLTDAMTSEFGLLEKITETLTPLGNDQFEVRVSTYDFLRGKNNNTSAEPKTGDASLSATGGRQSELVILREGLMQANRTGLPLPVFAIGEVPLVIGKPLAKRMLKRRVDGKQSGNCALSGWDESLETGVFFTATGRSSETLGIYIVEGYRVQMDNLGGANQKVATEFEASEI